MTKRPGYTLVELLVTIALLGTMVGVALPVYAGMQRHSILQSITQEVADAIRTARNRALTAQAGSDHRLQTFTDHYALITMTSSLTENHALPANLALNAETITFRKLTGNCTDCGGGKTITVTLGSLSQTIQVAPNGQVSIQ